MTNTNELVDKAEWAKFKYNVALEDNKNIKQVLKELIIKYNKDKEGEGYER